MAVCNNFGVPIPEFSEAFCIRCLNLECSRSTAQSSFSQRVTTWEDRLFLNPPRMDASDPRYATISAHKFVGIGPSTMPGLSSWIDPRDLEEKPEVTISLPAPAPAPPHRSLPVLQEPPVEIPTLVEAPEPVPVRPEPQIPPQPPMQTPFQQGTMLGTAPSKSGVPSKDPWDLPPKTSDGTSVVKPGSKFRFGDG